MLALIKKPVVFPVLVTAQPCGRHTHHPRHRHQHHHHHHYYRRHGPPHQHQHFSTRLTPLAAPRRTRDFSSSFSNTYDPDEEGRGPMFAKSVFGVPQFYPRDLKKRVDEYIVGQERAKKQVASVVFNHYQGLRRRHQQEEQERKREERIIRRMEAREKNAREREPVHPADDDFPAAQQQHHHQHQHQHQHQQHESVRHIPFQSWHYQEQDVDFYIPEDTSRPQPVKIDKSNLLLIGPTGVGKTYILETLSKKIKVPFTICDCNSFTQAGYIGQDVESCIERLLIEANYDIKATEHGIVVLDEFDKIAKRETINGRDVGGEGVQQALLKLVEGTKVTVNVKDNRSSTPSRSPSSVSSNFPGSGYASPPSGPQATPPPAAKVDQYTIDTSNILFVFCGAFVGLDKAILNRVAKPSMGFGSELRRRSGLNSSSPNSPSSSAPDLPPELFSHLPHRPLTNSTITTLSSSSPSSPATSPLTALDLTTPEDLQAFGFIPELIGRLHNIVALSPLSRSDLLRILTEPRNSLVAQYTALFETYPSTLRFTRRALAAVAERAEKAATGARGLKMEMERVLAEAMFDAPVPFVLVTEAAVKGAEKVAYWGKDGRLEVERRVREEDGVGGEEAGGREVIGQGAGTGTFEEYRKVAQGG